MKSTPPMLTPILRSDAQGRLLAELMVDPDRELILIDLARRASMSTATVTREVERLVLGGYLLSRRVGKARLVRMNQQHPLYPALRQIVMYGYGPAVVLPQLLTGVAGVQQAYIYGSWAARYAGEPGPDPRDVDVLVVGTADQGEIYEVTRAASERLSREVNVTSVSAERWETAEDGFIRTVRGRPILPLELTADEGEAS